jgi:UDP-sulfoquinovose synthase
LATLSPAEVGEYRVFNQITEQFSLLDLAGMVVNHSETLGMPAQVSYLPNPRVEKEQHYYNATHTKLMDLGLKPHLLNETLLESLMRLAILHKDNIDPRLIAPTVNWRNTKNDVSTKQYREQQEWPQIR